MNIFEPARQGRLGSSLHAILFIAEETNYQMQQTRIATAGVLARTIPLLNEAIDSLEQSADREAKEKLIVAIRWQLNPLVVLLKETHVTNSLPPPITIQHMRAAHTLLHSCVEHLQRRQQPQ